jgi:hypothetical protein
VPAALYEQTRRFVFPVLSKERDWHAAIHDLVRLCRFALGADISARVPTDTPRCLYIASEAQPWHALRLHCGKCLAPGSRKKEGKVHR